jgi:restriction endonuclease S subunit
VKQYSLGDCFRIRHGYAFKGEYFTDSGHYIVLTPGNFYEEGGFRLKPGKEKYYVGEIPIGYILNEGNLIVAMTEQAEGLLGSPAVIPKSHKYLHNQRLGLVHDLDERKLDKQFLYYLFNHQAVRGQICATANGAKVRHTSPSRIYDVVVSVPEVPTQRRIAAILSAYDDLIENNTRRIAILEEMARALYQEWFVHFRFPGHEHVPLVDSPLGPIPEGWVVDDLQNFAASFQDGDWIETKDQGGDAYRLLQVSNIGLGEFIETGNWRFITQETFERLRCCEVVEGDLLISRMPKPIGRAWMVTRMPFRMITAVDVAILRINKSKINQNFLYCALNSA